MRERRSATPCIRALGCLPGARRGRTLQFRERVPEPQGMWFRLLSLLFLVGCIWAGAEIYTEGTAGAFGGALARIGPGDRSLSEAVAPLERIRGSATGARDRQLSRIERQLGDPSVGLRDHRKYRPND